ncbi:hypothetical protein CVO96_13805 [Deinococcus koreensis]|uniref:DUF1232 domain-containing protein n=1 Tax=Deinococcus koreensis TaxID=2054903 RepID=A0A2K3V0I8_9DEIO|nr:YkvA family protein [Deinococcus koreensis]PNY82293.1 hypothetical protein CVO96_13805 [Deinococcus koreensis]
MLERLKTFARALKADLLALSVAVRDPRTPWYARAWAALVLAYALSPIDLIPDFIPVLGYLDDLLLVPAGLWLALRLLAPEVLEDARREARERPQRLGRSAWGLALVIGVYLALIVLAGWWWTQRGGPAR